MNDERNPELERLFAAAERNLADDKFVARVMAETSAWSARRLAIGIVVSCVAVPAALLAAGPLSQALQPLMQLIAEPLVGETGNGIASRIALPLNSVGAALALALLGLRALVRRFLRLGS